MYTIWRYFIINNKINGYGFVIASLLILLFNIYETFSRYINASIQIPQMALLGVIHVIVIIACLIGFLYGKQGAAIFAIIYGLVLTFIDFFYQGMVLIVGILLMIGGIIGAASQNRNEQL